MTEEIQRNEFEIVTKDNVVVCFKAKINMRNTFVEIKGLEEKDIIDVTTFSSHLISNNRIRKILSNQILGIQNSIWFFLFALVITFTSLILAFNKNPTALTVIGIVSLSLGGVAFVLFIPISNLITQIDQRKKNLIDNLNIFIEKLIVEYSLKKPSVKICRKCFTEVEENQKICKNCKISLKR